MEPTANEPTAFNLSSGTSTQKRSRRGTAVFVAAGVLSLLIVVILCGRPPRAKGPLRSLRDADGKLQQSGDLSGSSGVAAKVTLLNANQGMTASTVSSSTNGATVHANSVAIYILSDHPLIERVGLQLFDMVKTTGPFQEVQYFPYKTRLPDGSRLPDLFVTLDVSKWYETGVPGRVKYDGVILMTVGKEIARSNESVHDSYSVSRVDFHSRASLKYEATQTGLETAAAKYQTVGEDIAKGLAKTLTKDVQDLVDKYGRVPDLPAEFFPAYQAPPRWKFLVTLAAEKLVDGSRLMSPTYATWRVVTKRPPAEFWPLVLQELGETGWTLPEWSAEKLPESIRATQGADWCRVFPERRDVFDMPSDKPVSEWRYVISLERREQDLARMVRVLLDAHPTESQLLFLQNQWHLERERVAAFFQQHPPTSTDSMIILAEWLAKTDREAARALVLKANTLRKLTGDDSIKSRLETLQKTLEMDGLPTELTEDELSALQLSELRSPGELTLTAKPQQTVRIWLGPSKEGLHFLELKVVTVVAQTGCRLRVRSLNIQEHGRSWSESTAEPVTDNGRPQHTVGIPHSGRVEVFSRLLPESNQVELRLRRTDPAANP